MRPRLSDAHAMLFDSNQALGLEQRVREFESSSTRQLDSTRSFFPRVPLNSTRLEGRARLLAASMAEQADEPLVFEDAEDREADVEHEDEEEEFFDTDEEAEEVAQGQGFGEEALRQGQARDCHCERRLGGGRRGTRTTTASCNPWNSTQLAPPPNEFNSTRSTQLATERPPPFGGYYMQSKRLN